MGPARAHQRAATYDPREEVTSHRSRPGDGYRLRRAPECLRGMVANGQQSTDSIGAPGRSGRGTSGAGTADYPLGPKLQGVHGATDGDPHRDRSRNEPPRRSGGGCTSDPPKRPPSLGPRIGIRRLRDEVTPPTGRWKRASAGQPRNRARGKNPRAHIGHRTIQRDSSPWAAQGARHPTQDRRSWICLPRTTP